MYVYARFEIVGRDAMFIPDEEVVPCHNYLSVLLNVGSQRNQGRQRTRGLTLSWFVSSGVDRMRGTAPFGTSPTSSIGGRGNMGLWGTRTRPVELALHGPKDLLMGMGNDYTQSTNI